MITNGLPLRYTFHIENSTPRTVPIVGSWAFTPCCSSIGPVPIEIRPHSTVAVPVEFRPNGPSGKRRLDFAVKAHDLSDISLNLSITADILAEWEAIDLNAGPLTLRTGESAIRRYRITSRLAGQTGLGAPSEIRTPSNVKAVFKDPARVRTVDGMVETSRDVEIQISPSSQPGPKSAVLAIVWDAGFTRELNVNWAVSPAVSIHPEGVVLGQSERTSSCRFMVTSEDPFLILDVRGSVVARAAGMSPRPARLQTLVLDLDCSGKSGSGAEDVTILTDNPRQPQLKVSVLWLSPAGSEKP
ncbi:MAG: hypothetical protein U0835_12810 [Isosphaeraceae bacterium]